MPFAWSGMGVIAYFTLVYGIVFFGEPRSHFPLIPWIVMYASAALGNLLEKGPVPVSKAKMPVELKPDDKIEKTLL